MTKTDLRLGAAVLALGATLAGCTDWAGYDLDVASGEIDALANMRESVIPEPYENLRLPPENAVPVAHPLGDVPAPYTQSQLDSVAATLTNPLQPTEAVLARGEVAYDRNCTPCHGATGLGDGPVVGPGKLGYAPPLVSGAALGRSPGYLYGIIDVGRGLMPPYGERITHTDRWAIVTYVQHLQRQAGATPTASAPATAAPAATTPAAPATPSAGDAAADTGTR